MQPQNQGGAPMGQYPPQMQPGQYPYQQPGTPMKPYKPRAHSHLWWILSLILVTLLFFGALGFGLWAFKERGTYKDQTDAIVAKEVKLAQQKTESEKEKEFLEREKNPLKTYEGPSQYGKVHIEYPKTWAAYIAQKDDATSPINGYFHPGFVPALDSGTSFALHIEVTSNTYNEELKKFESKVKQGKVTVAPFRAEKVSSVLGSRVEGEINQGQKDTMVLFPLRDRTLKISIESQDFIKDFNDIILKNLSFVP